MTFRELALSQKIAYVTLLGLLALMVIFSIVYIAGNQGEEGYKKCMADCEEKMPWNCHKMREKINCCKGSGGVMANLNGEVVCYYG